MSSNNYIKTESNLEIQMHKLEKNPNTAKNQIQNKNYEISNSNAFSINTHQMSNLLKSNNSNTTEKFNEKERLMLKNLEIKSEHSINIMLNKNSINEEINDKINYISNISEDKIYKNHNTKKSKDLSERKSSSNNSKNMQFNNFNINKSEITIEEESNLNINNKSNQSRKILTPLNKSGLNIPEEFLNIHQNSQKYKTNEDNYDEYDKFDYDYNTSNNSKIILTQSKYIDEEIIEEDIR